MLPPWACIQKREYFSDASYIVIVYVSRWIPSWNITRQHPPTQEKECYAWSTRTQGWKFESWFLCCTQYRWKRMLFLDHDGKTLEVRGQKLIRDWIGTFSFWGMNPIQAVSSLLTTNETFLKLDEVEVCLGRNFRCVDTAKLNFSKYGILIWCTDMIYWHDFISSSFTSRE